jgi:hypothetical protein
MQKQQEDVIVTETSRFLKVPYSSSLLLRLVHNDSSNNYTKVLEGRDNDDDDDDDEFSHRFCWTYASGDIKFQSIKTKKERNMINN